MKILVHLRSLPFMLAGSLAFSLSAQLVLAPETQARRAYSYADMYAPQQTEPDVVKPKKKPPRKPRSKPISVGVQKPVINSTDKEPVTALPRSKQLTSDKSSKKIQVKEKGKEELSKQKIQQPPLISDEEPPGNKTSADFERARSITLEELLGVDITKGMSSR